MLPVKLAVIVPALKLPDASRSTSVDAVLADASTMRGALHSMYNTPVLLFPRNTNAAGW
jgi:hypothetical protein